MLSCVVDPKPNFFRFTAGFLGIFGGFSAKPENIEGEYFRPKPAHLGGNITPSTLLSSAKFQ